MVKSKADYGSEFLYVENLLHKGEYRTVELEIEKVHPPNSLRTATGESIKQWTLSFKGRDKKLCLCKSNTSMAIFCLGDQPGDGWVGGKITLQPRIVKAFGENVPAIRIVPPPKTKVRRKIMEMLGELAVYQKPEGRKESLPETASEVQATENSEADTNPDAE